MGQKLLLLIGGGLVAAAVAGGGTVPPVAMPGGTMGSFGAQAARGGTAISIDQAQGAVQAVLDRQGNGDLVIDELVEFQDNFYASIRKEEHWHDAFELLVNRSTGVVTPEPGPNMMWNTKYGMMAVAGESRSLFPERVLRLEAPDHLVVVDGDAVRLRQVLGNLLANALRFTPEGASVDLALSTAGSRAVLQVSDSGPGIPADELPGVFDRFFRGRQAASAGFGIGLAVVRELTDAHGGSVRAANRPGGGAVFTADLPLGRRAPASAAAEAVATHGA